MPRLTRRYHVPSALRPSSLRIEPEVARELAGRGAVLIDVRRHDDPTDMLEEGVRIPPDEIPERAASFLRDVPIVLACT